MGLSRIAKSCGLGSPLGRGGEKMTMALEFEFPFPYLTGRIRVCLSKELCLRARVRPLILAAGFSAGLLCDVGG